MAGFCVNYLIFISIAGFIFLNTLGALALANMEALNIKPNKSINSSISLFVTAGVTFRL